MAVFLHRQLQISPNFVDKSIICIIMYNTNNTKARQERSEHMVIELDMESEVPIYVQLRNQIVKGIGKGELKAQEKLPTVRQLAAEAGVNTMTVNKAYQILKAEGYIKIDRRHGAVVADFVDMDLQFREKLEAELELLSAEASITGMEKAEFLKLCDGIYSKMKVCRQS
jgi:DNA-binding transcriptional regulator YhcF (GntR family)